LFHLIYSTKGREPTLTHDLKARLFPYMGALVSDLGGRPVLINGPADHVHVLAYLPPTSRSRTRSGF
jgi:REP element-mobilizing transposase RayT